MKKNILMWHNAKINNLILHTVKKIFNVDKHENKYIIPNKSY